MILNVNINININELEIIDDDFYGDLIESNVNMMLNRDNVYDICYFIILYFA